jgi:Holliday junction resolvase RusA-like endonuclease
MTLVARFNGEAVRLTLPEPPSANRWWRNVNGRMVTSAAARKYKAGIAQLAGYRVASGPVWIALDWYRGRRSGDLDKRLGVCLDALQGVLYESDAQIVHITARRYEDAAHPRIEVTVRPAP